MLAAHTCRLQRSRSIATATSSLNSSALRNAQLDPDNLHLAGRDCSAGFAVTSQPPGCARDWPACIERSAPPSGFSDRLLRRFDVKQVVDETVRHLLGNNPALPLGLIQLFVRHTGDTERSVGLSDRHKRVHSAVPRHFSANSHLLLTTVPSAELTLGSLGSKSANKYETEERPKCR
jgi:hypothetical protein